MVCREPSVKDSSFDANALTILLEHVHHLGVKQHGSPRALNGLPHGSHHGRQAVGADVGMGVNQDLGIGAVGHHPFEGLADVAALLASGVQFAVAVSPRPAFAKAVVGVGIHQVFPVQFGQIAPPRPHIFAPLHNNRANTLLHTFKRSIQPGGPCPHNHHLLGPGTDRRPMPRMDLGFGGSSAPPDQQLRPDRLLACVPALSQDMQNVIWRQCRPTFLAKLPLHGRANPVGLLHFLGQKPNLDL